MDDELGRLIQHIDDELQHLLVEAERSPAEALSALHTRARVRRTADAIEYTDAEALSALHTRARQLTDQALQLIHAWLESRQHKASHREYS
jgi:hypothetical protein